ncbi:MAG: T9SS type A sorting domain-containing protein [Bacteroidetes bacterium]|nr:T9SS type A sorting domain-containing protein [Bacteroidota bacterium]
MKTCTLFFLFILMMFALMNTTSIFSQELTPNNTALQIYQGNNTTSYNDITGLRAVKEKSQTEINLIEQIKNLKAADNSANRNQLSELERRLALERGDKFSEDSYIGGTISPAPENTHPQIDLIGNTRILNNPAVTLKAMAIAVEERGTTAGKIWVCYVYSANASSPDSLRWTYSTDGGLSWTGYAYASLGGTDKISYEDLDMEIIENTTGQKYIWTVYGYRSSTTSTYLTGGIVLQAPTFAGAFFVLSWPDVEATRRYYNIRITSDNANYPSNAYLYLVCSYDSVSATSIRVNTQRFARITNPYAATAPAVSYMSGNYWWQCAVAPANYYRTLYSDIAYIRNGTSDSLVVSFSGVPDSNRIFFAKSDINGTPPTQGHYQYGSNTTDPKSHARLSSNGNTNGSVICVFRQLTSSNWNVKYFRTLNFGNFAVLAGESTLWGSGTDPNYPPDIMGRRNSNMHYFTFETSSAIDNIHYVTVNSQGVTTHLSKMNAIDATSETVGPRAGYRFADNDSCFALYPENGPINIWVAAGCSGTLVNTTPNNTVIKSYELAQNFPNPFNPSTNIKYNVAEEGFVNIVLYDVLGKEVLNIVNEYKTAGSYLIGFNATGLPGGTYFYRMNVNGFTDVKKMILMK